MKFTLSKVVYKIKVPVGSAETDKIGDRGDRVRKRDSEIAVFPTEKIGRNTPQVLYSGEVNLAIGQFENN